MILYTMEKTFETSWGTTVVRSAIFDTNGTDLVDGIEIKTDNGLVEILRRIDIDELTDEDVDQLIDAYGFVDEKY